MPGRIYRKVHRWCLVNARALGTPLRVSICVLTAVMIGLGCGSADSTTLAGHVTQAARWSSITTIAAGVAAPYFGQCAQVAFRRAYGTFFGCLTALPMLIIRSLVLRGLLCIPVSFAMLFLVTLLTNMEAGKNSIISFAAVVLTALPLTPSEFDQAAIIAGTRAIAFACGAYLLMLTWIFVLPTTATGQVLMKTRRALGQLARFHALMYEPLDLGLVNDVDFDQPNGPPGTPSEALPVKRAPADTGDIVDLESPVQLAKIIKEGVAWLLGLCCAKKTKAKPPPLPMEGPTLSLDASAEERREAYMWRARHAFVSVVNELAAARDAQTMAHYEWYFFTVPLLRHKVMLPSHLLEVQLWSELEPVLPDRKVQYLSGCIAAVARILVNLRENMAGAIYRLQVAQIQHTAWKESANHKLYATWLQACQDLLGYYAAVCPTSDLRMQSPISRAPLRRMQVAAAALRQHGHPLVRKLAPYHRPLVRVEALKLVLMDEVPELVRGDEETRHVAHLLWLELEVDTIARHFSRLQAALEDLLGHVPGEQLVVLHAEDARNGAAGVGNGKDGEKDGGGDGGDVVGGGYEEVVVQKGEVRDRKEFDD